MQVIKTENGVKVITDHGEELVGDVILFATGNHRCDLLNSNIINYEHWYPCMTRNCEM